MPSFSVPSPQLRREGARLPVRVGVSEFAEAAQRRSGNPTPPPIEIQALIDSGSGRSIIQQRLASELGLTPVGEVEIDTPSSTDLRAPEYYVRFWFDERTIIEMKVLEAPLPVAQIRALIGRDILARGRFIYDGPRGEFSLVL